MCAGMSRRQYAVQRRLEVANCYHISGSAGHGHPAAAASYQSLRPSDACMSAALRDVPDTTCTAAPATIKLLDMLLKVPIPGLAFNMQQGIV